MLKLPSKLPYVDKSAGVEAKRMIIEEMESIFGQRDTAFTIDDDILYRAGSPMVWTYDQDKKRCRVLLSNGCLNYWPCFLYEMSHESVHLLNPQPASASFLEEGVAVWFSNYMMKKAGNGEHPATGKYLTALNLISAIPDTPPEIVKKIRSSCKNLTDLTDVELMGVYPTLELEIAKELVSRME